MAPVSFAKVSQLFPKKMAQIQTVKNIKVSHPPVAALTAVTASFK